MLEWNLWCIKVYKQLQQGQNEDTQSQSWVNSRKIKNLSAYPIAGKWWGRKHFPFAALPVHMSLVQVNMLCSIDQGKCKDPPFDKDETCECPKTAFGLHSGGNTGVFNGVSMNLSFGALPLPVQLELASEGLWDLLLKTKTVLVVTLT